MTGASEDDLQRCDFCGTLHPVERLASWPCADFEWISWSLGDSVLIGCACHRPASAEFGAETDRIAFQGRWAACPNCRQNIERDDWPAVLRRVLAPMPRAEREAARTTLAGTHQMFQAHRLAGRWEPLSTRG